MIKKLINILLLMICVLLSGCQNTNEFLPSEDGRKVLSVSMSISDFITSTRAVSEAIRRMDLLVFDEDGLFIEHVKATGINASSNSFNISVSQAASIIHFIANYDDIDNFNEFGSIGKSEKEIIPSLVVSNNELVFWGREELTQNYNINVLFIRNQAKISVLNNASGFIVTGFDVCNYSKAGTISPFVDYDFIYDSEVPTIPANISLASAVDAKNNDDKYMCEYPNPRNNQTFVILKATLNGGPAKYYKVLMTDSEDEPYTLVRNVNYRIVINKMNANVGSNTFEEAKEAASINHLYADVMKDSPVIADNKGNSLTVIPLTHILIKPGNISSDLSTTGNLGNITYEILSDPDNILSNISCSNTRFSAYVSTVADQTSAEVNIKYGKLARTISILASPDYILTARVSRNYYSNEDTEIIYTFNLDTRFPLQADYPDLYPIKCYIKTDNLYPVDNKDMLIDFEYVSGEYWYVYIAETTGDHTIRFKTKFGDVDDKIIVRSEHFGEATVNLVSFGTYVLSASTDKTTYSSANENINFNFNLDTNFPSASMYPEFYPIKCYIRTENLTPVANLETDRNYVSGEEWYVYEASRTGNHSLAFKTIKGNVNGEILIRSEFFNEAMISLKAQKTITISASQLRAGKNTNNSTVSIYTDSGYSNLISTCRFNSNNPYALSSALTLTIPGGIETVYFRYRSNSWPWTYFTASISVTALESGNTNTLSFK